MGPVGGRGFMRLVVNQGPIGAVDTWEEGLQEVGGWFHTLLGWGGAVRSRTARGRG